jgi:L-asparaginase II
MFLKDLRDEVENGPRGVHIVAEERNGLVEALHRVHIGVVDSRGRLLFSSGDPETVTYTRSCIKPIQALPVLTSGAADEFGFDDRELAIISGSHSGEKVHLETVLSILKKSGIEPSALKCKGHAPFHKDTAKEMGGEFTPLHDNCSGKHSGALAACKKMGWDLESYLEMDHPLTLELIEIISELTGSDKERVHVGSDGCDIPNFAIPIDRMAHLFVMLMDPPRNSYGPHLKRLGQAMMNNPFMVAGTERFDTVIMNDFPGKVLSKAGAAGLQSIALRAEEGWLGIALKIEDGAYSMIPPLTYHVIEELGCGFKEKNSFNNPEIRTRSGRVVGLNHVLGHLLPS